VDQIVQADDIGDRLKQARLTRGLSLSDIASRTKISPPSLTAMERNDFSRLPGGVFRRAYVRLFAEEVGLDAEALVREYRARYEPDDRPIVLAAPSRRERTAWMPRWSPVAALAAAGLLLAMWTRPAGDDPAAAVPGSADETEANAMTAAARDGADDRASSSGANDLMLAGGNDEAGAPLRLKLQLSNPSWISVYADGQRVVYRLVHAGESLRVEATRAITLHAGDAGAVDYALNGEHAQPLGGIGQVRTVRFTGHGRQRVGARPSEPPQGVSPVG
jgi:cytoskeletal protein RodZ